MTNTIIYDKMRSEYRTFCVQLQLRIFYFGKENKMEVKKTYLSPQILTIFIHTQDILTTSPGGNDLELDWKL